MALQLNEIERKILDYMVHYLRTNTYQPSIREIGERFDIKSTKTVSEHLQSLAEKGFLERDPSRSRGVRILGVDLSAESVSVPCYAEFPREGLATTSDGVETQLTIDRRLAGAKGSFFVRANGADLASLGVSEGDYLLIEPADTDGVEDGEVVVARLEAEPAYYRLVRQGEAVELKRLGRDETTAVESASELNLVGRVTLLFRRMDGLPTVVSTTAH